MENLICIWLKCFICILGKMILFINFVWRSCEIVVFISWIWLWVCCISCGCVWLLRCLFVFMSVLWLYLWCLILVWCSIFCWVILGFVLGWKMLLSVFMRFLWRILDVVCLCLVSWFIIFLWMRICCVVDCVIFRLIKVVFIFWVVKWLLVLLVKLCFGICWFLGILWLFWCLVWLMMISDVLCGKVCWFISMMWFVCLWKKCGRLCVYLVKKVLLWWFMVNMSMRKWKLCFLIFVGMCMWLLCVIWKKFVVLVKLLWVVIWWSVWSFIWNLLVNICWVLMWSVIFSVLWLLIKLCCLWMRCWKLLIICVWFI